MDTDGTLLYMRSFQLLQNFGLLYRFPAKVEGPRLVILPMHAVFQVMGPIYRSALSYKQLGSGAEFMEANMEFARTSSAISVFIVRRNGLLL